jgi:hypothetical protein
MPNRVSDTVASFSAMCSNNLTIHNVITHDQHCGHTSTHCDRTSRRYPVNVYRHRKNDLAIYAAIILLNLLQFARLYDPTLKLDNYNFWITNVVELYNVSSIP